jgi:hypothetical protein
MFNWRLSRRRFLGSAAAVIGLPYLPSVVERHALAAASCADIQRFIAFFVPNGIHMPDFTPTTAGLDWQTPYILESLDPIKKKIAVVTGLDHQKTAGGEPPGGHGSGTGCFLTMMPVNGNDKNPARISLDQKIAKSTAACNRPLQSLQLGCTVKGDGSDKVPNLAFIETISWDANNPLPFRDDPQKNFDRIFEGVVPDDNAADEARRRALRTSVLDNVLGEAESLKTELSPSDRLKLDEYMTSVRELETRIQNLGAGLSCKKPDNLELAAGLAYEKRIEVSLQLAALAFECDATRVISFMFGRGNSMQDFAFLFDGESTPHHHTSHHAGDAKLQAKLKQISRWEVDQVATFLKRLDQSTEAGNKTVLDNSLAYFNSEISDGNWHAKYDMPVLLAGSAGGKLKVDGSHHMYTQMTFPRPTSGPKGGPHTAKLFVSIMNAFGIMDQTFGDGTATGPLEELMV